MFKFEIGDIIYYRYNSAFCSSTVTSRNLVDDRDGCKIYYLTAHGEFREQSCYATMVDLINNTYGEYGVFIPIDLVNQLRNALSFNEVDEAERNLFKLLNVNV